MTESGFKPRTFLLWGNTANHQATVLFKLEMATRFYSVNVLPNTLWKMAVRCEADWNSVQSLALTVEQRCEEREERWLTASCPVCVWALHWVTSQREPDNDVRHVLFSCSFLYFTFHSLTHFLLAFVLYPLNCLILLFLWFFLHLSAKALAHCAAHREWSLLIANLPQINFRMRGMEWENGKKGSRTKGLKGIFSFYNVLMAFWCQLKAKKKVISQINIW